MTFRNIVENLFTEQMNISLKLKLHVRASIHNSRQKLFIHSVKDKGERKREEAVKRRKSKEERK